MDAAIAARSEGVLEHWPVRHRIPEPRPRGEVQYMTYSEPRSSEDDAGAPSVPQRWPGSIYHSCDVGLGSPGRGGWRAKAGQKNTVPAIRGREGESDRINGARPRSRAGCAATPRGQGGSRSIGLSTTEVS